MGTKMESRVFQVAFKHPHFGWLKLDREYATKTEAIAHAELSGGYPHCVISTSADGERREWRSKN